MSSAALPPSARPLPSRSLPMRLARRVVGIARRSPTLAIGAGIILAFALLAIFHGWAMPHDPVRAYPTEVLKPPSVRFWFGTDGNGMDVFSRVIYGTLYAFGIALPSVAIGLLLGVPIGLWTGYRGGMFDETTMRVIDALRVFPIIILALAIVAATGQSLVNVIFVIGLIDAPIFVRVVRAEVLALRSSNFVEAARALGNPTWRILFVHLLPNALRGAIAQTSVRAAWAVRISATLAFLGVGIQQPTPEWGAMIRQGAAFIVTGQWWVAMFPGCALILLVLGFNMFGDGAQDLLDPQRKTGK